MHAAYTYELSSTKITRERNDDSQHDRQSDIEEGGGSVR